MNKNYGYTHPGNICIVRLSALGDVLMLVPLVRAIQKTYPETSITWIISKPAYDLVDGLEHVEFVVIDKPKSLKDYWQFKKMMQGRRFDVLLATQASLRANLLYPWIKADRKIGYDKRRAKDLHRLFVNEAITPGQDHTLESFLKFAQPLGIYHPDVVWDLTFREEDYQWAETHVPSKRYIVINPAASKPERSWSASRYIEVIRYIKQRGFDVVLTGGPGEHDRELADKILAETSCYDLVGKTRLKQLMAVIAKANLALCPDTGPAHMATAVGTPVVALHAVTNPGVSAPYLFQQYVVNCYPKAAQEILQEDAKALPWGTQIHSQQAMSFISVADVQDQLEKLIGG